MQAILFDMDGVLYNSESPIEGAAEALAWVRARRIPHLFVTNTSSQGRAELAEKLRRFGMAAEETPGGAGPGASGQGPAVSKQRRSGGGQPHVHTPPGTHPSTGPWPLASGPSPRPPGPWRHADILTPAVAAADWLREHASGPIALFVKPATRPEFDGLPVLPDDAETGARSVVI